MTEPLVYIATSLDHEHEYRMLRDELHALGARTTFDWTTGGYDKTDTAKLCEISQAEIADVKQADVVVVILPAGRATHGELAVALALGKPVVLIADPDALEPGPKTCPFYHHPLVVAVFGSIIGVAEKVREIHQELQA